MKIINLADFADGGITRERVFRERVAALDVESFRDEEVLIKGCADMPIPTWAFMMITARVAQVADMITFGEEAAPMVLYERAPEPTR